MSIVTGFVAFSVVYVVVSSLVINHPAPVVVTKWSVLDLSTAMETSNSLGKITTSFTSGGMNLSISGNVSQLRTNLFYGVHLATGAKVNATLSPFFQIWVKTNSIYVAGTIALLLDSGANVTIMQKTYNDIEWHLEIVHLGPFLIPPERSVVALLMGLQALKSSSSTSLVAEFSRPEFDSYTPSPRL